MLNLDTHVLVHALAGALKPSERELLSAHQWCVSAIVLWELAKLHQLGRLTLDIASAEFREALRRIRVLPLDVEVCRAVRDLDFRGDPADEIIAATSLVHRIALVTRDARIRRSKLVPLASVR